MITEKFKRAVVKRIEKEPKFRRELSREINKIDNELQREKKRKEEEKRTAVLGTLFLILVAVPLSTMPTLAVVYAIKDLFYS